MNRTDRLTGIILALQAGRKTAAKLAERFEVSRRTILRDIDTLSQLGVPIVALPGAGGGYTLVEGYYLPPLNLSPAEATIVLLGLQALAGDAASPFGPSRQTAEDKIRAVLNLRVLTAMEASLDAFEITPLHPASALEHFRRLNHAIEASQWVRLSYTSARRVATHDCLPIRLVADSGRWYCRAFSMEARAERSYRLDRIQEVAVIPAPPAGEHARQAATALRRPYDDPTHPEIVVRLTYAGVRQAEDVLVLDGRLHQIGDHIWELRFRCPEGELNYYTRAFYGMGTNATVLAPEAVRAAIRELAQATVNHYGDAKQ
ncbi:MAG TPA: YafY family protein [Thermomicrobiales bacterium]|nr:YafY family protein [Thermomicrobiales bacterium]